MGKKYLFENREQLIELLSLSIELVDKHFYRYCVYYDGKKENKRNISCRDGRNR